MTEYLLKGILIGLLFGVPVGAVGAMTVKNSWAWGFKAGVLTGLGSTAADCIYSIIGAFGLTLISDFLLRYSTQISVIGGAFIIIMGVSALTNKNKLDKTNIKVSGGIKIFSSSFAMGITNPAAVLTFIFAFSYFGISYINKSLDGFCLVLGVFTGTLIWWVL
ncbi:MAG: LysE family translocator, partial [Eubacterium sp.]|nr:LysE family translocator [Eubacterium sp.]